MVATFASLKSQSKELTNFQTYRGGGEFDASGNYPTHEQGGINVVDSRSGRKMAEFEQGEYAYFFKNADNARKFKPFFDDINNGKLSKWNVSPLNLQIPDRIFQSVIAPASPGIGDNYLKEMNSNIKKMVPKTTVEYVNGYRIEKTGNHTRKIKLSNGTV